jgi:DNA-binding PadR family transcriptional regulator
MEKNLICFGAMIAFALAVALAARHEMKSGRAREKILDLLTTKWKRGRDILQSLRRDGLKVSYLHFYNIMNDLVKEGCAIQTDDRDNAGKFRQFRLPLTKEEEKAEAEKWMNRFNGNSRKASEVFEAKLPELARLYPGEYVAINLAGDVLGHGTDEAAVAKEVTSRHPYLFSYIGRAVRTEKIEESPEKSAVEQQ